MKAPASVTEVHTRSAETTRINESLQNDSPEGVLYCTHVMGLQSAVPVWLTLRDDRLKHPLYIVAGRGRDGDGNVICESLQRVQSSRPWKSTLLTKDVIIRMTHRLDGLSGMKNQQANPVVGEPISTIVKSLGYN